MGPVASWLDDVETQTVAGIRGEGNAGKNSISETWPNFVCIRIKLYIIKNLKRRSPHSSRRETEVTAAGTREPNRKKAAKSAEGPTDRRDGRAGAAEGGLQASGIRWGVTPSTATCQHRLRVKSLC